MIYSTKDIVDIVAIAMLPIGFVGFLWQRRSIGKAIDTPAVQFIAVVFLLPIILILALEKVLDGMTVGTLIGAFTGYLLAGARDARDRSKDERD
ncbi:MAG: hypothetical protein AB1508_08675 [Pseudomonadota bacterium]